jgi:hypothetical protein
MAGTMTKEAFDAKVAEARKNVEALDRIDGFADRDPKTILFALEAGIRNPDSGAQYDAYVMLKDLCKWPVRKTSN